MYITPVLSLVLLLKSSLFVVSTKDKLPVENMRVEDCRSSKLASGPMDMEVEGMPGLITTSVYMSV
jgi:hypothetical protein